MTEKDLIIKMCEKFKITYDVENWKNDNSGVIKTKSHELGYSEFKFNETEEIVDLF